MQKARRHGTKPLRQVVSVRFQGLFHSPVRGTFHLSLTVLVHYRSSGSIILICLFANALAFASAANRTITGVVISGEDNEPPVSYTHLHRLSGPAYEPAFVQQIQTRFVEWKSDVR